MDIPGPPPRSECRRPVAGPLPARRRRRLVPTGPAGAPTGGGSVAGPGPVVAPSPGSYRPGVAVDPSLGPYRLGGAVAGHRPARRGPRPVAAPSPGSYLPPRSCMSVRHRCPCTAPLPVCKVITLLHVRAAPTPVGKFTTFWHVSTKTGLCVFTIIKYRAHGSISAAAAGRLDRNNNANLN